MAAALQLHILYKQRALHSAIAVMQWLHACTALPIEPRLSQLTHCAWLKAVPHHNIACPFRSSAWAQDPGGEYVAKWVPELTGLPKKYLHKPWDAPAEALQAAGVELGQTYPHRIETQRLEVMRMLPGCLVEECCVYASKGMCLWTGGV